MSYLTTRKSLIKTINQKLEEYGVEEDGLASDLADELNDFLGELFDPDEEEDESDEDEDG